MGAPQARAAPARGLPSVLALRALQRDARGVVHTDLAPQAHDGQGRPQRHRDGLQDANGAVASRVPRSGLLLAPPFHENAMRPM
eukprot:2580858-Pyramimonas_sp.AAC.2